MWNLGPLLQEHLLGSNYPMKLNCLSLYWILVLVFYDWFLFFSIFTKFIDAVIWYDTAWYWSVSHCTGSHIMHISLDWSIYSLRKHPKQLICRISHWWSWWNRCCNGNHHFCFVYTFQKPACQLLFDRPTFSLNPVPPPKICHYPLIHYHLFYFLQF